MKQKVFLDSSVLFTATNSPTGGSAKLLTIQTVQPVVSTLVLTEVERNVRKKLLTAHLDRFFILAKLCIITTYIPSQKELQEAQAIIASKDAIILSQAKRARVSSLITLDRKHFFTKGVERFLRPKRVYTPKDFLAIIGL